MKNRIAKLAKDYYQLYHKKRKFIPGKSRIGYAGRVFDEKELASLINASLEFWLTAGRFTKDFEQGLAEFLGLKYCSLTNSGSSANLLAVSALTSTKLKSRQLKPGDEVITTASCFPTTLTPVLQNNLKPVFVDVGIGDYNILVDRIENAVSKKTRAIIFAHTLGNPVNMSRVMKIVRKHKLWLIEDNCDSLGSKFNNKYTGTFGHISTSSFYPAHLLTMGEGGAVLTNDPLLRQLVLSFRDWGRDCWCESGKDNTCRKRFSRKYGKLPLGYDHKYVYSHIGYNLKPTDLQSAIGVAQLNKLNSFIAKRKSNFKTLYQALKKFEDFIILPKWDKKADPAWFAFPLSVRPESGLKRAELVKFLEEVGIQTRQIFAGNILRQPGFSGISCRRSGGLKNTDFIMNNSFFIGVYPGLGTKEINYMIDKFNQFFKQR